MSVYCIVSVAIGSATFFFYPHNRISFSYIQMVCCLVEFNGYSFDFPHKFVCMRLVLVIIRCYESIDLNNAQKYLTCFFFNTLNRSLSFEKGFVDRQIE